MNPSARTLGSDGSAYANHLRDARFTIPKPVPHSAPLEHRPPLEILAELRAIEQEILQGIEELEGMLR